jgi:NADP-dependent 3-hydroxy acid dehydrogenase YdfG
MPFSDYRKALVTGASSGIGSAVVERLRREGLEVHALARSAKALEELARRTGCVALALDVTDLAGVTKLAKEVEFDILVNNAGVDRPKSLLKADAEDIDLIVDVNLRAALHLCRLIVPNMVARDRGHIINISSIAAAYNFGGNSTYHATKAGISMLSSQLRIDVFGRRVRVTEICPGRVATDIFAHVHGASKETHERFVAGYELPEAKDIADAIAFAIAAPIAVNVGYMEITPTLQVPGGLSTAKGAASAAEPSR